MMEEIDDDDLSWLDKVENFIIGWGKDIKHSPIIWSCFFLIFAFFLAGPSIVTYSLKKNGVYVIGHIVDVYYDVRNASTNITYDYIYKQKSFGGGLGVDISDENYRYLIKKNKQTTYYFVRTFANFPYISQITDIVVPDSLKNKTQIAWKKLPVNAKDSMNLDRIRFKNPSYGFCLGGQDLDTVNK